MLKLYRSIFPSCPPIRKSTMANDSVYGLGGAVWTKDINRALRVAGAIETGRLWVNTYNQILEGAPFGGYKQSGIIIIEIGVSIQI